MLIRIKCTKYNLKLDYNLLRHCCHKSILLSINPASKYILGGSFFRDRYTSTVMLLGTNDFFYTFHVNIFDSISSAVLSSLVGHSHAY